MPSRRSIALVDIAFDPIESGKNEADRGCTFAARAFLGRTVVLQDIRRDCGGVRMIAIGEIEGRLYKVVFTDRGNIRRIISADSASRQEKRLWPPSE